MVKLFITLYLMVIASFGVFALYVGSIDFLGESLGEGAIINEKISKGTFMLLNKSLDGLDNQQTENRLQKYKTIFGDEFSLAEKSSFDLNETQIKALASGKIISVDEIKIQVLGGETSEAELEDDDEVTVIYYQKPNTSLIWRADLDYELDLTVNESGLSIGIEGKKFAQGMMYLIQAELLLEQQEKWSAILAQLQPSFGLPLALTNIKTITKDASTKENWLPLIKANKVVNITQGSTHATFVKQIPKSNHLLQVGPVEIPWYLRNIPLLFILAFVLAFATTLFLWLWPLWSNLIKIKKAADDFGSGNYDARIPFRKWSPIAKVSSAFNAMAEQTQCSIRSHKELTSAVSHELRTPVARMRFALEMLSATDDKSDQIRFASDINKDIDELDLLLEELLTYARFDQNNTSMKLSNQQLLPWFKASIEKLLPLASSTQNKTINYKVENINTNETVMIDPRLMSRVLDNLVQNALRYANQRIEVTLSKDKSDYLLVVEDDGEGIPKAERAHIFDAFSRLDASRDRSSGGFGLGLAIVQRIVVGHQGVISIHDSVLGGARFEVRFPAEPMLSA